MQEDIGWSEFISKGSLVAREEFLDSDFKQGYEWMKCQMHARLEHSSKEYHILLGLFSIGLSNKEET
ncbi:MAG: hypothetical protein AAF487_14395 [Bacteroidota bacterium]